MCCLRLNDAQSLPVVNRFEKQPTGRTRFYGAGLAAEKPAMPNCRFVQYYQQLHTAWQPSDRSAERPTADVPSKTEPLGWSRGAEMRRQPLLKGKTKSGVTPVMDDTGFLSHGTVS